MNNNISEESPANDVPALYQGVDVIVRHEGKLCWRQEPELLGYLHDEKQYSVKDDDVWVVSYPRGGCQWLFRIVTAILHEADATKYGNLTARTMGTVESHLFMGAKQRLFKMKIMKSPRVFTAHLRPDELPASAFRNSKIICVVRNPKDTAVSYYNKHKVDRQFKTKNGPITATWEEFFDYFAQGDVMFGSWFDFVLDWNKHRSNENILFLNYEVVNKDLPAAVHKICNFLGKNLTKEHLEKIEEITTLPQELKDTGKGVIGGWKKVFTKDQNSTINQMCKEKLNDCNMDVMFE